MEPLSEQVKSLLPNVPVAVLQNSERQKVKRPIFPKSQTVIHPCSPGERVLRGSFDSYLITGMQLCSPAACLRGRRSPSLRPSAGFRIFDEGSVISHLLLCDEPWKRVRKGGQEPSGGSKTHKKLSFGRGRERAAGWKTELLG